MAAQESECEDPNLWFRLAFEQSPDGLALATPMGAWTQVNATLCRWLGYAPDKLLQIAARAYAVRATPFWRYSFKDLIPAADQQSASVEDRRFELPGQGGRVIALDITVSRLSSPTGETLGLLGRFTDNQLRRRLEQIEEDNACAQKALQAAAASVSEGRRLLCAQAAQLPEPLALRQGPLSFRLRAGAQPRQLREWVEQALRQMGFGGERLRDLLEAVDAAAEALHLPSGRGMPALCWVCGDGAGLLQVRLERAANWPTLMLDGPHHAWREVSWMKLDWAGGWHAHPPAYFAHLLEAVDRVWFYPGRYNAQEQACLVLEASQQPWSWTPPPQRGELEWLLD